MMQKKLTLESIYAVKSLNQSLWTAFVWRETPQGQKYWQEVYEKIRLIGEHGTTDGKPWVEPEPPKPEPRIPTDEDAERRPRVRAWFDDGSMKIEGYLVVVDSCTPCPFLVRHDESRGYVCYPHCELIDEPEPTKPAKPDWRPATPDDVGKPARFRDHKNHEWVNPKGCFLREYNIGVAHHWMSKSGCWWIYCEVLDVPEVSEVSE